MTIKEQIEADFMTAYKAKDMAKKNFLGVLRGAIKKQETQETKPLESTDENVLKVIKSMEKGILENIEGRKASSLDIAEQELELTYIKPYQPAQMSEDEIRVNIHQVIIESGETNAGKIMGLFNKTFAGKAFDNKIVSKLIKEELA
jgi:uncharacterized protein YqeY